MKSESDAASLRLGGASVQPSRQRALFGLLQRKEKWTFTWRAWLLLLCFIGTVVSILFFGAHPFLAVHEPNDSGVLVVEGWLPRYVVTGFVARYTNYKILYTTGGPTRTDRQSRDESDTYASVVRTRLLRVGVPAEKIRVVPAPDFPRDRTYGAAVALRDWGQSNHVDIAAFNVVTVGPHARRSRLLYQKAFGAEADVGIICLPNDDYEPRRWWRYSEGVKEVISESAAYLYARLFFSPD